MSAALTPRRRAVATREMADFLALKILQFEKSKDKVRLHLSPPITASPVRHGDIYSKYM